MTAIETLISVLCGPDGKCCISGSDDDRRLIDSALAELAQATAAQPAAQQAGEYPALVCDYCGALTPDPWHSSGMLHGKMSKHIHSCDACADATHTLRASHGQAPAQAASSAVLKAIREANMQLVRTGDDAFMLAPYKVATAQAAESVPALDRDRVREIFMAHGFTVKEGQTDLKQYVYDAADALLRAARDPADSVQEDAARYRFLRDCEWRDTDLEPFIRLQLNTLWDAKIDAARNQGATP